MKRSDWWLIWTVWSMFWACVYSGTYASTGSEEPLLITGFFLFAAALKGTYYLNLRGGEQAQEYLKSLDEKDKEP
jgi:hypothetical protein